MSSGGKIMIKKITKEYFGGKTLLREYDTKGNLTHLKHINKPGEWEDFYLRNNTIYYENSDGLEGWEVYDKEGEIIFSHSQNRTRIHSQRSGKSNKKYIINHRGLLNRSLWLLSGLCGFVITFIVWKEMMANPSELSILYPFLFLIGIGAIAMCCCAFAGNPDYFYGIELHNKRVIKGKKYKKNKRRA